MCVEWMGFSTGKMSLAVGSQSWLMSSEELFKRLLWPDMGNWWKGWEVWWGKLISCFLCVLWELYLRGMNCWCEESGFILLFFWLKGISELWTWWAFYHVEMNAVEPQMLMAADVKLGRWAALQSKFWADTSGSFQKWAAIYFKDIEQSNLIPKDPNPFWNCSEGPLCDSRPLKQTHDSWEWVSSDDLGGLWAMKEWLKGTGAWLQVAPKEFQRLHLFLCK